MDIIDLANIYIVFIMISCDNIFLENYYLVIESGEKSSFNGILETCVGSNGRSREGDGKETLILKDHLAYINGEIGIWERYADLLIHLWNSNFH